MMSLDFEKFFAEDELGKNFVYDKSLPQNSCRCHLNIKSPLVLAGLPYFFQAFEYLGHTISESPRLLESEGKLFKGGEALEFQAPFGIALTAERIALNILHRASAIATATREVSSLAEGAGIKILDTRKTTPGYRSLEKYAVQMGGGYNHRLGQLDLFMIKDNHKKFFGSVDQAVRFFRSLHSAYTPILLEVHEEKEYQEGLSLGVRHFMLDNFSPERIKDLIQKKEAGVTFEVSGGINKDNIKPYLIPGVDFISMGKLTMFPDPVDISMKISRA